MLSQFFTKTVKPGVLACTSWAFEHRKTSLAILGAVLVFSYYGYTKLGSQDTVSYQYTTVKRSSIISTVSATGVVTPNSQVDIKPKVNANVIGVTVRAGDQVKAGQVLFRLDATDAYKQVRDAKTSLASAELALEKLRNPKTVDVMALNDSIKQEEDAKKDEDQKVATAYKTLLNGGLQAVPETTYTSETAPTLSGSYQKGVEGQIKIVVYQGGPSGYSFSYSGVVTGTGPVTTTTAQPIGDTGLYIKWNSTLPQSNWIINIPNKEATSYLTNYTAWQNAVSDRDIAVASSDRAIASLKQKLADLTPSDDDIDVRSALLTVEQRQNALYDANQNLANYTITAPFDGVMASVSVDIGSSAVMASSNSSAALGTIITDKKLAQITVNESDMVKLKIGQQARVTFDAVDGLTALGTIVEINTLGTITSGVVTYKVKVAFDSNDTRVLPNMSVAVDIVTDSKDYALVIPSQALKRDTNGYYVESDSITRVARNRMMNASGTEFGSLSTSSARFASSTKRRYQNASSSLQQNSSRTATNTSVRKIPVTTGVKTDREVEIIQGLEEGDQIILKKVSSVSGGGQAPAITSLFRPGNQNNQTRQTGQTRAQ